MEGDVLLEGRPMKELSRSETARMLSVVLTESVEIENACIRDIVRMGRQPHTSWWGALSAADEEKVKEAIALVDLEDKADRNINELSDGERQRAMIAKALAQDTPIVLLDEPTAHLDLSNRVEIMLLLHRLAHTTDKAILLSTHELDMALQVADRI